MISPKTPHVVQPVNTKMPVREVIAKAVKGDIPTKAEDSIADEVKIGLNEVAKNEVRSSEQASEETASVNSPVAEEPASEKVVTEQPAAEVREETQPTMHYFYCTKPDGSSVTYKRSMTSKTYAAEVESFKKYLASQGIVINEEKKI